MKLNDADDPADAKRAKPILYRPVGRPGGFGVFPFGELEFQSHVDIVYHAVMTPGVGQRDLPAVLAHLQSGRFAEVQSICRELLYHDPANFEAHYYLGAALQSLVRLEEAAESYRKALEIRPDLAEALSNLGIVLQRLERTEEGLSFLGRAAELQPNVPEFQNNFGNALHTVGRFQEAEAWFRRAVAAQPAFAEGHNNLGNVLQHVGRVTEAIASFRHAARLRPDSPEIFNNLGNALKEVGQIDQAIACYERALTLRPQYAEALGNLGNALKDAGHLDEAISCYDRALALNPKLAAVHSGKLYTVHFHPGYDASAILEEHRRWEQRHARPLGVDVAAHANDRSPGRKLRIGYVSPNFREHVIGRFLAPLLANHDRDRFEIVCYADVARADAMTARIRQYADEWRDTLGLSDEQLARQVRDDRVDILVDLTMHMGGGRLLAFARKPAPVQVTYLAYCSSTGLSAMDYRLTDPHLDPPGGEVPAFYSERSVCLPRSYWCYEEPAGAGDPGEVPAIAAGHVTFGCLNNFCKVTAPTVETWCRILRAAPGSRMLIHASDGTHRRVLCDRMGKSGIDPERIEFVGFLNAEDYFKQYRRIDVALDPFPYAGGTTTCDALWMGVPVVTLAGATAVSRSGVSILSNIGLQELIACDCDDYVRIALDWGGDMPRLADLRRSLRMRMENSPLMDAPRFSREVEGAYRAMWEQWSQTETGSVRR